MAGSLAFRAVREVRAEQDRPPDDGGRDAAVDAGAVEAVTLDAVRVLPLVVGAILCLYEQTITAQRAFILSRHTARRKSMVMTGLDSVKFNIEDDIEDAKISRDSSSIQESFTKSKNAVAPDGLDGEKEARRSNFELPNMTFQNMKRESGEQQSQRKLKEKKEKKENL